MNLIIAPQKTTHKTTRRTFGFTWCALGVAIAGLACGSAWADHKHSRHSDSSRTSTQVQVPFQYQQSNLVSDLPDIAALQDTNLVNAWGVAFSSSGPFWIGANEKGLSLVYSVTNGQVTKVPLEVTIPGEGNVTGLIFNDTGAFNSNAFLFVSEDGTISGWRGALGTAAETLTTRPGAVYKGVTLLDNGNGPMIVAANFAEATLDVYDTNLALVGQFSDADAPAGYAPFNVQVAAGQVFVTFAKQDDAKEDDVPGAGHGLIDVFLPDTGTFHRFATGTDAGGIRAELDSPWGVTLSPAGFGDHGDQLLVGNFGNGTIMTFDANGFAHGLLTGSDGNPISIDGLWTLTFGNGGRGGAPNTLYFTAGPDGENHGLFGSIKAVRTSVPGREHGHGRHHGNGDDDDDDDQGDNDQGDNDQGDNDQGGHTSGTHHRSGR